MRVGSGYDHLGAALSMNGNETKRRAAGATARARTIAVALALFAGCFAAGRWGAPQAVALWHEWFPPPPFETADNRSYFARYDAPVLLFATKTCPYCRQARGLFDRQGVRYHEIDAVGSAEERALYATLGAETVPITLIGDRRIFGYDEAVLLESIATLEPVALSGGRSNDGSP